MSAKWIKRFGFYSTVGYSALACASGGGGEQIPTSTTTMQIGSTRPIEITTRAGLGEQTFYAPEERVFAAVDEAYGLLEIPLTTRNPAGHQLGNSRLEVNRIENKRMATYVDCGQDRNGRLANTHDITLQVQTSLRSVENDGVSVTTVVAASGKPRAVSGNPLPCNSTGALEERIAELVAAALIAGA